MERNLVNGEFRRSLRNGTTDEQEHQISLWVTDVTVKANLFKDKMTDYRKNIAIMKDKIDKIQLEKQDLMKKCEKYEREIADLKMKNGEKDLMLNIAQNLYPNLTNVFSRSATNHVEMTILMNNEPPCNSNELETVIVEPEISTEDLSTNIEDTNDVFKYETMNANNPENEVATIDVNNVESSQGEEQIGDGCVSTNDSEGPNSPQKETGLVCKWVTPLADGTPQLCDGTFKTARNMLTHMRMHHLRTLTGNVCCWQGCKRSGFRFEQKRILDQHVSIHIGYKPFQCTYEGCGQMFPYSHSLEAHVNSHMDIKVRCTYPKCKAVFACSRNMRSHRRRVHKCK